jgi:hypothetical protein
MSSYIVASGFLFALLAGAHVFRLFAEGLGPLVNPVFVATTLASAGMAIWAWSAYRAAKRLTPGIGA